MKIKVYIDTNIFIYAIIHHPMYGEVCSRILKSLKEKKYDAYGSLMVAIELLGSLSRINSTIAKKAMELYLSLDMAILPIDEKILSLASIINEVVNVGYDAIHAALMILNEIPIIITNDKDDWFKLARNFNQIRKAIEGEGYEIGLNEMKVITPDNYLEWYKRII